MFAQAASFLTVLVASATALCSSTTVSVFNNCTQQVDPAFTPQVLLGGVPTGGFPLAAHLTQVVTFPANYSGRAWGRTGCDAQGVCATGQCFTGGENCTSPAPAGPTLAQFTINGFSSLDFFNPTSGEGFNLPVTIKPGSGCSTTPVSCTAANNVGPGCGATSTCPTGVGYTIQFC
ncbi:Osmotin thaumatin-like protein [Mycena rosella]|uniref:Osmotin thaumatin-like protein n=1 Tax=Mycena rosella TaxID=1033263 RepID=A0AAD7C6X2_MYCRO|nr:Osmotin thaumatin-like protein [Mycena rosella]